MSVSNEGGRNWWTVIVCMCACVCVWGWGVATKKCGECVQCEGLRGVCLRLRLFCGAF